MNRLNGKLITLFTFSMFLMFFLSAVFLFNKEISLGGNLFNGNQYRLSLVVMFLVNILVVIEMLFLYKHFFGGKTAIISSLLFLVSPWAVYASLIDFKIVLVTFVVLSSVSIPLIKTKYKYLLYLLILILVVRFNLVDYLFANINPLADIRHINSINEFQGILKRSGCLWCYLIENRYLYYVKLLFINFIDAFSPAIYFFPQVPFYAKSFVAPAYSILLVPFAFGVWNVFKMNKRRFFSLLIIFLVGSVPSSLALSSPNMTKLFLISPLIFLFIANGAIFLISNYRKYHLSYVLLFGVLVQYLFTLLDIWFMESKRF